MFIDPGILAALAGLGCAYMGYLIGSNAFTVTQDDIIESTIDHLCAGGYLKHNRNSDGEVVLHKLTKDDLI